MPPDAPAQRTTSSPTAASITLSTGKAPLTPALAAERLLRWLRASSPYGGAATALNALVARLDISVERFSPSLHPDTLGFLEPGENLIFLRSDLPEPLLRFTLAHELGHAALHRATGLAALVARGLVVADSESNAAAALAPDATSPDGCADADLDAPLDGFGAEDETLRPGQAYSARARRENEANAFAAALLLPADMLLARYLGDPTPTARELAQRFGVSEDVVLRRLTALLTPDQSGEPSPTTVAATVLRPAPALDDDQLAAARVAAPALVIAGPGAGKTSALLGRIHHLVADRKADPAAILALTFSNKAAREMRERLTGMGLAGDGLAGGQNSAPTVSTIHAFCGELLRRYAPLVGLRADFRLVNEVEAYLLLRAVVRDLPLLHYQPLASPTLHLPDLLAAISRAKDELTDATQYAALAERLTQAAMTPEETLAAERAREVALVYTTYQQALAARGDPDFGDVIRLAVQLLREQPDVLADARARYQHVLVDEFQDINRAMGVLLHTLTGAAGPLWAVGDADQAIYRFRGASPTNLTRFTSDYTNAQVVTLRRNYRSVPAIVAAASAFAGAFLANTAQDDPVRRSLQTLQATRSALSQPGVSLADAPDEAAELAGLVSAIQQRAQVGYALGDQAVLCRTRRQVARIVAALRAAGVPAYVAAPLLEQSLTKDLLAVLALLTDTSGAGFLRAGSLPDHHFSQADAQALLAATHERGVSPLKLLASLAHGAEDAAPIEGLSDTGRAGLLRLYAIVGELRRAPDVATGLARYIFTLTTLGHDALTETTSERAMQLARLLALARAFGDQQADRQVAVEVTPADEEADVDDDAHQAAPQKTRQAAGADWAGFLDYARILLTLRHDVGATAEERLHDTQDAVRVLTVHGSKGLEFPIVYLPMLVNRRFPTSRRSNQAPILPGLVDDDAHTATGEDAHLAEEACLFYVALTRARDEVILSYAKRYGRASYRVSPFLAPIEHSLRQQLHRLRWDAAPTTTGLTIEASEADTTDASDTDVASTEQQVGRRHTRHPVSKTEADGAEIADEPLSLAALETYQRCPQQYAYRYVYELRPEQPGMVALRRGLRETLRELHELFAAANTGKRRKRKRDDEPAGAFPTLGEALATFDAHWSQGMNGATGDPAHAIYLRYGHGMIERVWLGLLARLNHSQLPPAAGGQDQAQAPTLAPGSERQVTIQLAGQSVEGVVDYVEEAGAAPTRYVRFGAGRQAGEPSLRDLFYLRAAEDADADHNVTPHHYSLATGEIAPLTLSQRQIERLEREAEQAITGLEHGVYPPKPEPRSCQNCPFLLICPG